MEQTAEVLTGSTSSSKDDDSAHICVKEVHESLQQAPGYSKSVVQSTPKDSTIYSVISGLEIEINVDQLGIRVYDFLKAEKV